MHYQIVVDWVLRIIRLDFSPLEEVRRDPRATFPIIVLVAVISFLSGLGSFLWALIRIDGINRGDIFVQSFVIGSLFQLALWFLWVFIAYLVLTQLFRASADLNQMLRVMGLAFVPMSLALVMFIPQIDFSIGLVAVVATVLLTNTALLDSTNARPAQVMLANLAGFAIFTVLLNLATTESSAYAPGFFVMDYAKDGFLGVVSNVAGFFSGT